MRSKRRHEGYLLVDHRAGDGMPLDLAQQTGALPVRGGFTYESATITCSHCQRIVVLNPDRSRERAYCANCDHYLCDQCGLVKAKTGVCRTFNQIADEAQNRAASIIGK